VRGFNSQTERRALAYDRKAVDDPSESVVNSDRRRRPLTGRGLLLRGLGQVWVPVGETEGPDVQVSIREDGVIRHCDEQRRPFACERDSELCEPSLSKLSISLIRSLVCAKASRSRNTRRNGSAYGRRPVSGAPAPKKKRMHLPLGGLGPRGRRRAGRAGGRPECRRRGRSFARSGAKASLVRRRGRPLSGEGLDEGRARETGGDEDGLSSGDEDSVSGDADEAEVLRVRLRNSGDDADVDDLAASVPLAEEEARGNRPTAIASLSGASAFGFRRWESIVSRAGS
jgi:hypothetical protein